MTIGPVNPFSSNPHEERPNSEYLSNAKASMNQMISQKYGADASVDNIEDYSTELFDLIQEFKAAPNTQIAEEVFQRIQLSLSAGQETSEEPKQINPSEINKLIEQFIPQSGFSGSVMVVQNGKPIFAHGYGDASEGVRNTENTTFRWDSVSKIITATAALQLSEKGKLNLNIPITKYLPEYSHTVFDQKPPVTLFSLLSMTSGIADLQTPQPGWEVPPTLKNMMDYVSQQPRTNVGQFHYSNTSFNLIAMIIGRVFQPQQDPGTAFSHYLQQHIFNPAGMSTASAPTTVAEDHPQAQGHKWEDGHQVVIGTNQWPDYTSLRIGAGNINGSIWDFQKFDDALNSGRLISMKDLALMRDERLGGWDPGMHSVNGVDFLAKGGEQDGEETYYMTLPNHTMIFITANTWPKDYSNPYEHIQYLGGEIASLLFPEKPIQSSSPFFGSA